RYVEQLDLTAADAALLVADPELASYFEGVVAHCGDARTVANWVTGELLGYLNASGVPLSRLPMRPVQLAALLREIQAGTVSIRAAKDIFAEMCRTGAEPAALIEARGLRQISDEDELAEVVRRVIADHPGPVADFRSGKEKALGFLVGQVMRHTQGRANPQLVNRLLREQLHGSDGSN
ncbi:MAG TPA: Asp-tRNA(Asn)/Glu-tRNA(Gln) amidotransferase GatCAB subunit B, partial [Bacillota bacterium]